MTIQVQEATFGQTMEVSDFESGSEDTAFISWVPQDVFGLCSALGVHPCFCSFGQVHSFLFSRNMGHTWLCMTWMSTLTLTLHHIPYHLLTSWINSEFQERAHGWSWWASCSSLSHCVGLLIYRLPLDYWRISHRIWKCERQWLSWLSWWQYSTAPSAQTRFTYWLWDI